MFPGHQTWSQIFLSATVCFDDSLACRFFSYILGESGIWFETSSIHVIVPPARRRFSVQPTVENQSSTDEARPEKKGVVEPRSKYTLLPVFTETNEEWDRRRCSSFFVVMRSDIWRVCTNNATMPLNTSNSNRGYCSIQINKVFLYLSHFSSRPIMRHLVGVAWVLESHICTTHSLLLQKTSPVSSRQFAEKKGIAT